MDFQQTDLYARIQTFSLDQLGAPLSFSKRLARDNGWSLAYAQRVIEEYKKFVFLAVAADHPVTPSDQVDQVWHLHLSYTRSYWEEFCPHVLQLPLHHDPTYGGDAESQKFGDWYSNTLESYKRFFGHAAPTDIWSAPEVRFGRDLRFVRVNTQLNWIVPKLQIRRGATVSVVIFAALILGSCNVGSSGETINPVGVILLGAILVGAGFGLISALLGVVRFLKHPTAPFVWIDNGDTSFVGWGNSLSHHGSNHSASSIDSGIDAGGGCGGGGCGGGGCGGGGCGGGISG
ncbi:MAG: glycine-rich domain-containing protein [Elainellaceae cyanobacterium]